MCVGTGYLFVFHGCGQAARHRQHNEPFSATNLTHLWVDKLYCMASTLPHMVAFCLEKPRAGDFALSVICASKRAFGLLVN